MSNYFYSENIQGVMCLDASREWRFRDDRKDLILSVLGLVSGMTVLDAGCGPGTLTRKLSNWLGASSYLIGVDLDAAFIAYARKKAKESEIENIEFIEGDVLALPLADNCVDASVSHTVIEHVPNHEFLLEQKRVCRSGGIVSVIAVTPENVILSRPGTAPQMTEREEELCIPIFELQNTIHEQSMAGKYRPAPFELPHAFDELGFSSVRVDALALPVVPDDSRNSTEQKIAILESDKIEEFENIDRMLNLFPRTLSKEQENELKELIEERYSTRLSLLEQGIALWDYTISIAVVVSGIKS